MLVCDMCGREEPKTKIEITCLIFGQKFIVCGKCTKKLKKYITFERERNSYKAGEENDNMP